MRILIRIVYYCENVYNIVCCRSGIIYVLFAFNSWLSPSFVVVFGPRVSMLVAALLYVFYVSQYLYLNTYSVYVATVLVGLAAPVIWTAQVGTQSVSPYIRPPKI